MSMKSAMAKALCALVILATAFGCSQNAAPPASSSPVSQSMAAPTTSPTLARITATPTPTQPSVSTTTPIPTAIPTPTPTPSATSAPAAPQWLPDLFSGGPSGGAASGGEVDAASVEDALERGLRLAGASPTHLAFRGTAAADSVRCGWRGIARTPGQREAAIRFWLDLAAADPLPSPAEAERRFTAELDRIGAVYPATVKSNFSAIARGGMTTGYTFLSCYADFTVAEYILGSGPAGSTKLAVAYDRMGEARSYELYKLAHAGGEFGSESLMSDAEYDEYLTQIVSDVELVLSVILEGRESVVFLAPMGAHNAIAVEAWQAVAQWDLQTDDNGVVQAVRYGAGAGDPEHTQTLANLKSRIAAATTAATAPTRIANVSGLAQYYRDIGAYGDISPGDGSTDTFTPAQPPPVPTCAGADAVSDHRLEPGLARDCSILLDSMDALRGAASLDWSATTAISSWEGVSLNANSTRVKALELDDEDLDGTIPPALGGLSALETLDLSDNDLSGELPEELGRLWSLTKLRLSGNSLTGCIPTALRDVADHDLSSLKLPFCDQIPPAPQGLTAGATGATSVSLSWTAVRGVSKYRVERRTGSGEWSVASDSITGTSFTAKGLTPSSEYAFRVSAYGDGTTYRAVFGAPSAALLVSTSSPPTPTPTPTPQPRPDAPTITGVVAGSSPGQLVVSWEWDGDACFITGTSSGYEINYKKATASWRDVPFVTAQSPNDSDSGAYEIFKDYGRSAITETFTIGASASGVESYGQVGVALDAVAYDVRVIVFSGVCADKWSPYSQSRRATPTK